MSDRDPRHFFPAEHFGAVTEVTPISRGLSGAGVYAVTTTRGSFILKLHGGRRDAWHEMMKAQRRAADHGVAPALERVDEAEAATVSRQATGVMFAAAAARPATRAAAFASLVQQLAVLHAISADGIVVKDSIRLSRFVWDEQSRRPGFPAWALALGERLAEAAAVIAPDRRAVLSHGDLNPGNVIWDGERVWLVDWEQAGLAHPYLDLASLSIFLNLADDDALALLAAQERTPIDAAERAVFRAFRDLTRIGYGAVFLRLVPDLTAVQLASRAETPTLAECYQMMAAGQLVLGAPRGQALIGAALFRQCTT